MEQMMLVTSVEETGEKRESADGMRGGGEELGMEGDGGTVYGVKQFFDCGEKSLLVTGARVDEVGVKGRKGGSEGCSVQVEMVGVGLEMDSEAGFAVEMFQLAFV
ncbi:Hypothetical predicted protein [Xyrichtys novacula]|uniref:Uncharacterized protein n=1 Tax=Xyrichtys novacula TaxID=13765 RepID=A0AAV1GE36_XYRNO|nr:Hypothetical predicted protein [Xyrichtys novacula]